MEDNVMNEDKKETWVVSIRTEPGGKKSLVIDDGMEPEVLKTVPAGHVFTPAELCTELATVLACSIPGRIEFDGEEFKNDQVQSLVTELGIETPVNEKEGLVVVPGYNIKPVMLMPEFGY
jgi:hypothetical protein